MKIVDTSAREEVPFMTLKNGDVFVWSQHQPHMKIAPISEADGHTFNAVCLADGEVCRYGDMALVVVRNASLILE